MTIPPPPPPLTPRRGLPSWAVILVVVGALFVALLFALGGGLSVLLILAAVAAIVVAIVGLTRPLSALGITSRRRAGSVLAVAAVALLIASINTGVSAGRATPTAQGAQRALADGPTDTPSPTPSIEVRQVTDTTPIPFQATTVNDGNMDVGTTAVTTAGIAGVTTTTYTATFVDGVEASRVKTSEQVTTAPVDQVTSVGTRTPPPPPPAQKAPIASGAGSSGGDCNQNYADACVPNASDVDCAGGGGNGPAYLSGQARVVGRDVYDLDRDRDGIACD